MADVKIVSVRCPKDFLKSAEDRAEALGYKIGPYIRSLIAADLGVEPPDMPTGLAGASADDRKRVSELGGKRPRKQPRKKSRK